MASNISNSYLNIKLHEKILITTIAIVTAHGGQSVFNMTETAKIINKDKKFVGPEFDKYGILAKLMGKMKYFTAESIAEYLYMAQVSPLLPCRKSA